MSIDFPYQPEKPVNETLRFLTDVMTHKDGTEQRVGLRIAPRQEFSMSFMREDGRERQVFENLLSSQMKSEFLVPVWFEPAFLTAAANNTDLTLTVESTLLSDFRVGSKAMLWVDEDHYQIVNVTGKTSTTLTITGGVSGSYPIGTEVYPVRKALISGQIRVTRYLSNLTAYTIVFRITENAVNLYSGSLGFPLVTTGTDTGKVIIDDFNCVDSTLTESFDARLVFTDGGTGAFTSFSTWNKARRGSVKTWKTHGRDKLWDVRTVLHFLNGQRTSFMLPTFASDLTPQTALTLLGTTLDVERAGFDSNDALGSNPRKYIRLAMADGSIIIRVVTNIAVVDSDTERLTVSSAWGVNAAANQISRASVLEKVRMDTDEISLVHDDSLGTCTVTMPVKAVTE